MRRLRTGGHLDQAKLAHDGFRAVDLVNLDGGFELVERGLNTMRYMRIGGAAMRTCSLAKIGRFAHDGHARGARAL